MIKIELDYEMADNITRANLVDMYDTILKEIDNICNKAEAENLKDHEKCNLVDCVSVKKSLERVLRHISVKSDLEQYGLDHLCDW